MKRKAAIFHVLAIATYAIAIFMHLLVIIALHQANLQRLSENQPDKVYAIWPLIVGIVLLTIGMAGYLFTRYSWSSFAFIVAGTVLLAFIGLDMMRHFPPTVISGGHIAGYDSLKVITRHMIPILTTLFALLRIFYKKRWEEKTAMEEIRQSIMDNAAKGASVFQDENS